MTRKLLRICPHYHTTCKDANDELEKQNRVCTHLAILEQNTPEGVVRVKICVMEALALNVSDISAKMDAMLTGGHKELPKLFLPGAN